MCPDKASSSSSRCSAASDTFLVCKDIGNATQLTRNRKRHAHATQAVRSRPQVQRDGLFRRGHYLERLMMRAKAAADAGTRKGTLCWICLVWIQPLWTLWTGSSPRKVFICFYSCKKTFIFLLRVYGLTPLFCLSKCCRSLGQISHEKDERRARVQGENLGPKFTRK